MSSRCATTQILSKAPTAPRFIGFQLLVSVLRKTSPRPTHFPIRPSSCFIGAPQYTKREALPGLATHCSRGCRYNTGALAATMSAISSIVRGHDELGDMTGRLVRTAGSGTAGSCLYALTAAAPQSAVASAPPSAARLFCACRSGMAACPMQYHRSLHLACGCHAEAPIIQLSALELVIWWKTGTSIFLQGMRKSLQGRCH